MAPKRKANALASGESRKVEQTPLDVAINKLELEYPDLDLANLYRYHLPRKSQSNIDLQHLPLDTSVLKLSLQHAKFIDDRAILHWLASKDVLPLMKQWWIEVFCDAAMISEMELMFPIWKLTWASDEAVSHVAALAQTFNNMSEDIVTGNEWSASTPLYQLTYMLSKYVYRLVCTKSPGHQMLGFLTGRKVQGIEKYTVGLQIVLTVYADLKRLLRGFFAASSRLLLHMIHDSAC